MVDSGIIIEVLKGDTRSLDYSSFGYGLGGFRAPSTGWLMYHLGPRQHGPWSLEDLLGDS